MADYGLGNRKRTYEDTVEGVLQEHGSSFKKLKESVLVDFAKLTGKWRVTAPKLQASQLSGEPMVMRLGFSSDGKFDQGEVDFDNYSGSLYLREKTRLTPDDVFNFDFDNEAELIDDDHPGEHTGRFEIKFLSKELFFGTMHEDLVGGPIEVVGEKVSGSYSSDSQEEANSGDDDNDGGSTQLEGDSE